MTTAASVCMALGLSGILICGGSAAAGAPQEIVRLPVDVEHISDALRRPPPERRLKLDLALPVATFRTSVVQRVYLPTFEELPRKEFTLTPLQQQSQDWYGRCCGIDLMGLVNSLDRGLKRREERKIREQVRRELAQVEAAASKNQR